MDVNKIKTDYIGKKIHYKSVIEFKGEVIMYSEPTNRFVIKVTEWLSNGYPHLVYYLTKEEIENEQKTKLYQD